MWALELRLHDRLLDEGHVAGAGAGHGVGDVRRRPDLDLPHPLRREVVRRRAADRRDIAYTYNRVLDGGVEGDNWARATSPTSRASPRPTTRPSCSSCRSPTPCCRCCRSRSCPSTSGRTSTRRRSRRYADRADRRPAGRRLRPVPAGRGQGRRVDVPLRGQPRLLGRRAARRPGRLPGLQEPGPGGAGADQGRDRLRRRHHAAPGARRCRASRASPLRTASRRSSRRSRFNTGAVDTETGKPMGDGNPALQDPKFRHALGYAVDTRPDRQDGLPGRRRARARRSSRRRTPTGTGEPARRRGVHLRPRQGRPELLDAAGYKLGSDGKRTMPDGSPIGTLRLFARSDAEDLGRHHGLVQGVARRARHRLRGHRDGQQHARRQDPRRQLRRLPVGLVRRARPGRDPRPTSPATSCGGCSDSWYCDAGLRRDVRRSRTRRRTRPSGSRSSSRCSSSSTWTSPYIVTAYTGIGEAFRSDRFACFQPQPDPGGVWLIQYGARNYTLLRPAKDAGDCDGVTTAPSARRIGAAARAATSSSTLTLVVGRRRRSPSCSSGAGSC